MLPLPWYISYALSAPTYRLKVAVLDGMTIGLIAFELHPEDAYFAIIVAPNCRNIGYGRRMISTALTLPELVTRKVIADCAVDNVASIRCFIGAGFSAAKRTSSANDFVSLFCPAREITT